MAKDELYLLHFTLGKDIRNSFGLYSVNTALLDGRNADDVSIDIIFGLWDNAQN